MRVVKKDWEIVILFPLSPVVNASFLNTYHSLHAVNGGLISERFVCLFITEEILYSITTVSDKGS